METFSKSYKNLSREIRKKKFNIMQSIFLLYNLKISAKNTFESDNTIFNYSS